MVLLLIMILLKRTLAILRTADADYADYDDFDDYADYDEDPEVG